MTYRPYLAWLYWRTSIAGLTVFLDKFLRVAHPATSGLCADRLRGRCGCEP